MKITIDFELDRRDYLDDDGLTPPPEVTDAELVLGVAQSDYKKFAFDVADQIIKSLEDNLTEAELTNN